jgi:hypothetical protein
MSDTTTHSCGCGKDFDTLEALKKHTKDQHPDIYEEKYGG